MGNVVAERAAGRRARSSRVGRAAARAADCPMASSETTERRGAAPDPDAELLVALRAGDEAAFATLVDRYGPLLLRVARMHVRTEAAAEDVVQETWLGVLRGLERFEGRSSLKTWLVRIAQNRARTRGERDARSVPLSSLAGAGEEDGPTVDADRFLDDGHPRWPGHWAAAPRPWEMPEARLLGRETLEVVREAIAALPERQAAVIALRDVEGLTSEEVCDLLDLSEGNQRVLLHRARARVREALAEHLSEEAA